MGTGRPGTDTDGWEYRYHGHLTPRWPGRGHVVDQRPTLVGSVIRAKPHKEIEVTGWLCLFLYRGLEAAFSAAAWPAVPNIGDYRVYGPIEAFTTTLRPFIKRLRNTHTNLFCRRPSSSSKLQPARPCKGRLSGEAVPRPPRGRSGRASEGGEPSSFQIVGIGRPGTDTAGWEYHYHGHLTRHWPDGVDQRPALVGSVMRAKPQEAHRLAPAGYVAPFIAVKTFAESELWSH